MDKTPTEDKAAKKSATAYTYLGGGFLHGVPSRDLTKDDIAALPADVSEEDLESSGLYKKGKG